jgi:hypothetical protein
VEWIHDVQEFANFPKIKVQKKIDFNEVHSEITDFLYMCFLMGGKAKFPEFNLL